MPIQYAEFGELSEILSRSNHETSYTDLMSKEKNVLDTVNAVVKHYQQKKGYADSFASMRLADMAYNMVVDISALFREIISGPRDFRKLFLEGNRLIYIGILLVVVAFLFAIA